MIRLNSFLLCLLVFSAKLTAQDNHFSHYENAPLYLNPATTGVFVGDKRLIVSYRQQWSEVLETQKYKTNFVSFDQKLNATCRKNNFFSLGGFILSDEVSALHFQNIQIAPSVSFHKSLSKTNKSECSLLVGSSLNIMHQRLDYSDAHWGEQYVKGVFNPSLPVHEPQFYADGKNQQTDIDPSVGAFIFNVFDVHSFNAVYLGASWHHITKPKRSFIGDNFLPSLSSRFVVQAGGEIEFRNARWGLSPDASLMLQSNIWQINGGCDMTYRLGGSRLDINHLRFGGRIRTAYKGVDAFILSAGYDREGFGFGLSFDSNISRLAIASRGRGAIELSARYRFKSVGKSCAVGCPSKKF